MRIDGEKWAATADRLITAVVNLGSTDAAEAEVQAANTAADARVSVAEAARAAAERMAELHNRLRDSRYTGHDLELLLVRLVFCLFADDALIFERGGFRRYLETRTSPDGSDLGPRLGKIFEVLNTPEDERQTTLDEASRAFPYINGGLFAATIRMLDFSGAMRRQLLSAAALDWSAVSPAIFGSSRRQSVLASAGAALFWSLSK